MNRQKTTLPYYVVSAENFESLQKEVCRLTLEGFSLVGGVAITSNNNKTLLCQAMWSNRAMETYIEYDKKRFRLPLHLNRSKKIDEPVPQPKET